MARTFLVSRTAPAPASEEVRFILSADEANTYDSGVCLKGTSEQAFGLIKAGTLMGKVTASGLLRPAFSSTVDGAATSATQTLDSVEGVYAGDVHYFETAATSATVDSVDTANSQVTYTASVTTVDGEVVRLDDGAQNAIGILTKDVQTSVGVDPDDRSQVLALDQPARILRAGTVNENVLTCATPACKADLGHILFLDR